MTTSSIVLIVATVIVAILLIVAIARAGLAKRNQHRHVEAEMIREQAKRETLQVGQREAIADETAAMARAAQAEADVKAAQAAGLQNQADETAAMARAAQAEADVKAAQAAGLQHQANAHRNAVATAREQLNERLDRADTMDPASQTADRRNRTRC